MFTYEFEQFKQSEKMDVYLCRKADPESKGKVESVVKFIKINFLENRFHMGIDLLNQSFEAWLERTGNAKVHGTTKKVPAKVFLLEQEHLRPVLPTKLSVFECSGKVSRWSTFPTVLTPTQLRHYSDNLKESLEASSIRDSRDSRDSSMLQDVVVERTITHSVLSVKSFSRLTW